ncbi:MAG: hypothetical protein QOG83_1799 [Alphaproteobacteria bacterium]|nr:hypothetical protein [Alphaproteobacteria bacterium]
MRSWMKRAARAGLAAGALVACCAVAQAQDAVKIEAGAQLYDEHCASCHGEKMRDPAAAPDLRELRAADRARFDTTVADGKGQMPSWQGVLSLEEIDALWAYIRSRAIQ